MGIHLYSDYTLEDLQKDRKRHKELNPPPFKIEDFTEELCKQFGGEWGKSWAEDTCTVEKVETIGFSPSTITIGVQTEKPYEHKYVKYNGNYDLLFDFFSEEKSPMEMIGSVWLRSVNDKFFSEVRKEKQELQIPFDEQKNIIDFPSDLPATLKITLINPESGFVRCFAPNIHGRQEKVDCLEFKMRIFPRKQEKSKGE